MSHLTRFVPAQHLLLGLLMSAGFAHAPAAVAAEWDGYSFSALVGATQQNSKSGVDVQRPASSYFLATDKTQMDRVGARKVTGTDWSGSVTLGYGWQIGKVVTGIDISADTGFDQSATHGATFISSPTAQYSIRQRIQADPGLAIRPRIGWVWGDTMTYITAGLVSARVTLDTTYRDSVAFNGFTGASGSSSKSETRLGSVIGFGSEYALGKAWSLSAQYLYTDLGSISATTRVKHPDPLMTDPNGFFNSSMDLRNQSLMFGVTYRFND